MYFDNFFYLNLPTAFTAICWWETSTITEIISALFNLRVTWWVRYSMLRFGAVFVLFASSKFTPLFTASKSIKSSRHGLLCSLLLRLIRKSRKIPLMARWCKFEAKRTNLNGAKSKHSITVVSRDTHQRFLFPWISKPSLKKDAWISK